MRIAVIGAGPAGLCTARHILAPDQGFTCVVYEMTRNVGGAWVYTENTGKDQYGLPIGSVMYKNLRTNLSKDNMEFQGFPCKNTKSFLKHTEVLQYLKEYANHFNLMKNIKFLHYVTNIVPKNEKWQVTSTNLPDNAEGVEEFDSVIICNGHNSVPYMCNLPGVCDFEGEVMHSHTYRAPEPFSYKTVLVIGGGQSGVDITSDIATFASKVYLSHKTKLQPGSFPENVEEVPLVKLVKKNCVVYMDGNQSENIDTILLCTGYINSLPFLTPECEINIIDNKFVYPLHKDIININHPTMGFIGIPFQTFIFPLIDYQVQFFIKTLNGEVELPTREMMLAGLEKEIIEKQDKGVPVRKYHELGSRMTSYIEELATLAQLERLPPVVFSIYEETKRVREINFSVYKETIFQKLDDKNYSYGK